MQENSTAKLVQQILNRKQRAIARSLTLIENVGGQEAAKLLKALFPHTGQSLIVGVTGSPGSGKSTLVDRLAKVERGAGQSVGIIAVDPTSPFSGGAVLGDRIRMQSLFTDPEVFIRSMATRGVLGGLAASVNEALLVLDAAGYQKLIVETVGVGQDEVDIMRTAHMVLVVVVPGMGDSIQTIKAGIMEIADVFVVNKADRPETEGTVKELQALLSTSPRDDGWEPPIITTIATKGDGIQKLSEAVEQYRVFLVGSERFKEKETELCQQRLIEMLRIRLLRRVRNQVSEEELRQYAEKMVTREMDPYTIMDRLLSDSVFEERSHD